MRLRPHLAHFDTGLSRLSRLTKKAWLEDWSVSILSFTSGNQNIGFSFELNVRFKTSPSASVELSAIICTGWSSAGGVMTICVSGNAAVKKMCRKCKESFEVTSTLGREAGREGWMEEVSK